jgi:hypothetical protein
VSWITGLYSGVCVCVCVCVCNLFILFIYSFGNGSGVWTQGFIVTKQVLYHLSHITSPFCSGYFGDGILRTTSLSWLQTVILPISASQVARITVVSHQCPASDLCF